ncbi:MAG: TatD family hydrolase [Candidatus Moraniibacteriota bacterium]|nr:MAG: TatD family hydrolase [Candidatus Moranbacteria bacterium]
MIDTHAHIHDEKFEDDRDEVITRARENGIESIITVGTSIEESRLAIDTAKKYKGFLYAMVASHPHEYSKLPNKETRILWKETMKTLAKESCVVAIGECGLDYHDFGKSITEEQKQSQKEGFLDHIQLALEMGKPLVVHCREAYEDAFEILREYSSKLPSLIFHCYQGDEEITKKFLSLEGNIFFSFAGNITYPVKKDAQGTKDDSHLVVNLIPLEKIIVETDCPYLSPQKFRGKRNEPAFISSTLEFLAELRGISFEELERKTQKTSQEIFSLFKV